MSKPIRGPEEEALLRTGVLRGSRSRMKLDFKRLFASSEISSKIEIVDCDLSEIHAECVLFSEKVVILDSTVESLSMVSTYFAGGLELRSCNIRDADFQMGGHNLGESVFQIRNCRFAGFANFFDCMFSGPVVIDHCHFEGGTNLLGNKGAPYRVRFELPPTVIDNEGALDLDRRD